MDKETLSNYGWIVICVLVLAVMIALATPFGSYVSDAVQSTTEGLFSTNQKALNSTGLINVGEQSFDDYTPASEVKREAGTLIPGGATYTVKATAIVLEGNGTNKLPSTPAAGDTYEEGDYLYKYEEQYKEIEIDDKGHATGVGLIYAGWSVKVNDKTKTEYGTILSEISGQPIANMSSTFANCTSLTTAPAIPDSVVKMSLTFYHCTALTTAPTIPSSLTNMYSTFEGCTSLTGTMEINANPTEYQRCLKNTQITEVTGSTSLKAEILATK